jgi:malonate-semialdehyde dehydrogenase (acetylating)/methylmalonate-semialdehyde dehydrogenase
VEGRAGIACGNAFILKPSERDPACRCASPNCSSRRGLPAGILQVVNGDKEAVDAILDDPDIKAIGFVGSSPIAGSTSMRAAAAGQARAVLRRRQEPHDHHARRRHGPDRRRADRRRLRLGRRALHGDLGCRARRRGDRRPPDGKADPARREPEGRPLHRSLGRFRPAGDEGSTASGEGLHRSGVEEGAKLVVDGRNFKLQGYEDGFYMGGCLFDERHADMRIYKEEIFGPVLSVVRANDYDEALSLPPTEHEYGNGVAIFTRDGDAARDFASKVQVGMVGINVPIPVPLAYYTFGGWKRSGFGDLNQHGPDAIRFYTKTKTVTSRWPSGIKDGAEFVIPTMK